MECHYYNFWNGFSTYYVGVNVMKIRARYLHAAESMTNVIVGYLINLVLVYSLLHWIGFEITLGQNAAMGVIIAVVSFLRGYVVRRFYNNIIERVYNDN